MAGRELARRVTDAAANGGPSPGDVNKPLQQYEQELKPRIRDEDLPGFRTLDPDPETDPSNPSVTEKNLLPATEEDQTDTLDELEEKLLGRDLHPSGLDQPFPVW